METRMSRAAAEPRRSTPPTPLAVPRREAGFTLIEALVSVAIMVVVLIGLLSLLEFNSRVAKAQINVSDMQQSLRAVQGDMVRQIRMAGRGGLGFREEPLGPYAGMPVPLGPAIAVVNDVPDGVTLGGDTDATVRPGTDMLTVRGVLSTPLYQIEPAGDGDVRGARAAGTGSIIIRSVSPTGIPQDLDAIGEAVRSGRPEALILISSGTDEIQAVVQITGGDAPEEDATEVRVDFTLTGTHGADYLKLSPGGQFSNGLRTVAMAGLVEEYRYYIREPTAAEPNPRLSRARFYPGTESPHAGDVTNLRQDLADNILDLQIAMALDRNLDTIIQEVPDATDDWLFNVEGDKEDDVQWNTDGADLYYLRLTTLARTDRLDPKYVSPPIAAIEDHVYDEPSEPADGDERLQRSYRRRLLRTVVDMRNLS